ncbi:L-aminoadipate-semialdehyde dehydrogenase-phosphopantetheinyl transferase [Selaginella moellendorffii]|uniref:L-aminoadipate-semialdehyde dehydrogenase-phosphopantetheinyl transferase n=1 Tax=Selaginella moellendorffii TaxID=88036 RepID=UPI000D1C7E80|nr:L-aminoadipate-semialdehyde dehydrogenase-phosphopantetheinyl transferase [Selaginella moellendorffii]|eukprot:XP_024541458.1 L-aminoadipate-semialdehyde dehydrogenase-phosphopantetheinyl transferase [Selaginella moellendorffii]
MEEEGGSRRWAVNAAEWKPSSAEFDLFLSALPLCDWEAVLRFVRIEDRKMGILSRLLQRKLVNSVLGIPYKEIIIHRTPQGKPFLANDRRRLSLPEFNFNVSHHGDYVAIASEPHHLVGVDVMSHDPRIKEQPPAYVENFRSCFTALEWGNIMSSKPDHKKILHQFYRHWCLKEAYVKAIGIGLGFNLQRLEFFFLDGEIWGQVASVRIDGKHREDWSFSLHQLDNEHCVCVAKGSSQEGSMEKYPVDKQPFKILTVDELLPNNQK